MWEQCTICRLLKKFPKVADWADPPKITLCEAFRILVDSSIGSFLDVLKEHPFYDPSVLRFSLYFQLLSIICLKTQDHPNDK